MLIIVPAWNEEKAIAATLKELLSLYPVNDILVVDDGSDDKTAQIAGEFQVRVLQIPVNLGVGAAIRAGYVYAVEHKHRQVVHFDSDLQHNPNDIERLVAALSENSLVIGSRFHVKSDYKMNPLRRLASLILCHVVSKRIGVKVNDVTSGFRATSGDLISIFAKQYPTAYLADTVESTLIAHKNSAQIREIAVSMSPRIAGKPSHGQLKSALHFFRAMLVLISNASFKSKRPRGNL